MSRIAATCAAMLVAALSACRSNEPTLPRAPTAATPAVEPEAGMTAARDEMVRTQIAARGVRDPRVLAAMRAVPRHRFVPGRGVSAAVAYGDHPVPIGGGQTMSQPYIVAYMTETLGLRGGERVLEVGTGSGYQAAVLAEVGATVYTIEIVEPLARHAEAVLSDLDYDDVHTRTGDGYRGWPEAAPFDAVIVTAAPERVPAPLLEQLAVGGRLIAPVGDREQALVVMTKTKDGMRTQRLMPVRFVPMTGEAERRRVPAQ